MLRNTLRFIGTLPLINTQVVRIADYYETQDPEEALFWHSQAAKQGKIESYYKMGQYYEQKSKTSPALKAYFNGGVRGHTESVAALERFKAEGNPEALFYLGMIAEYKQEWLAALDNYTQSAKKQFAEAMYRIGVLYQQDRLSANTVVIKKDETQELQWYRKGAALYSAHALNALSTASQTNAIACIHLAQLYEQSEGLYKSQERMVEFYRKADELGDNNAAVKLGGWYETGLSDLISKDKSQAYSYYLKAAQRAHQPALALLEKIAQRLAHKKKDYAVGNVQKDVFKNTSAALIWYKKSADKGYEAANDILQQLANTTPQQAYDIGLLYEKDVPPNFSHALRYFMVAAKKEHVASKSKIEQLAIAGNVEAQYLWGYEYYHQHKANPGEAIVWCIRACEKNHTQAINYIDNTNFTIPVYLKIAKMYEEGVNGVNKNISRAVIFFAKASNAGNAEASFKLGQWYASGNPPSIIKDVKKAAHYYLKAAKLNYSGALAALEKIMPLLNDAQFEYEIATVYQHTLKNNSMALGWYKKASDKGNAQAIAQLQSLANSLPQSAYEIGCLYETAAPINISQALRYFMVAAKKEHVASKSKIEQLAIAGNVDAQYLWGYEYYLQQKSNTLEAVKWCMKAAEKNHVQAMQYLNTTVFTADVYFDIARRYERGNEGIAVNITRARQFYEKANQLQHPQAPFCLATLLINSVPAASLTAAQTTAALQFYLTAAQRKYSPALDCALRLVEQSSHREHAYQLAQYFEKNKEVSNALRWYMVAAHLGENEGAKRVEALTKGSREYSLFVADAYHKGTYGIKSSQKAYYYYAIAAYHGEPRALALLQTRAKEEDDEAQYVLGAHYYHLREEFDQAIRWCLCSAKQENSHARRYLNETDFPIKALMELGNIYERGNDIIEVNPQKARDYYGKAWRKGDSQAAYLLGRMALDYPQDPEEPFNLQAWDYFLAAAKKGNQLALPPLERLALIAPSQQQKQLADVYAQISALPYSQLQGVKWREQAATSNSSTSFTSLRPALPPAITSPSGKITYH